jgi:hypothetical protein
MPITIHWFHGLARSLVHDRFELVGQIVPCIVDPLADELAQANLATLSHGVAHFFNLTRDSRDRFNANIAHDAQATKSAASNNSACLSRSATFRFSTSSPVRTRCASS